MGHEPGDAGRADRPRGAERARAAGGRAVRGRGRGARGHHYVAGERLDRAHVGRKAASPERIRPHVGVERAATELRHRRGGGQGLEPDLLRIVAGVERQLVAGAGRSGQERERRESGGESGEGAHRSIRPSPPRGGEGLFDRPTQAFICGQVLSIQVYVEVGSPFVMLRIGIVMMRLGSRIWNG